MKNGYEEYFKKKRELSKKAFRKSKLNSSQGWLLLITGLLTAGAVYCLFSTDQATQFLSRFEVTLLGEAEAEEAKTEASSTQSKVAEEAKKDKSKEKKEGDEKTVQKTWSEEEITIFTKLETRKKELDAKETEINKLEEELQKQKVELEKKLTQLQDLRTKLAGRLEEKVKSDQQKIEALVAVYSNMKPVQAAKIFEGLHEDLAVEVLAKMKNKNAAEILNLMDADKAKKISEKFAGYREVSSTK